MVATRLASCARQFAAVVALALGILGAPIIASAQPSVDEPPTVVPRPQTRPQTRPAAPVRPEAEKFSFDRARPAVGRWIGSITRQRDRNARLFELRIVRSPRGSSAFSGRLSLPQHGVMWADLSNVGVRGRVVNFKLTGKLAARFTGTVAPDGQRLEGTAQAKPTRPGQTPIAMTFTLRRLPLLADLKNPQYWKGAIGLPGMALGVAVTIAHTPNGRWVGAIDIPAQTVRDLYLPEIRIKGSRYEFKLVGAAGDAWFRGTRNAEGTKLSGTFSQAGSSYPFSLTRTETRPTGGLRPQTPKPPFPYAATEVRVANTDANLVLAGTLTIPRTRGPHPAVILITGSGPQDRNETLLGHKPFWVLADYLTRRGLAVLRLDDRGVAKSTGDFVKATTLDFVTDIEAALAFLRKRPEIDRTKIGLLGHSEGGLIAPLVAVKHPSQVAFVVLLAGPAVPGDEIVLRQGELIARAAGTPEALILKARKDNERLFSLMREGRPDAVVRAQIRVFAEREYKLLTPAERRLAGSVDKLVADGAAKLLSPWFKGFLALDPRVALRKLKVPVFALFGQKDLQVPWKQNSPEMLAALGAAHNPDVTVRSFPGLNHLFQTATTGAPSEYAGIEETMSPTALAAISGWIRARTK